METPETPITLRRFIRDVMPENDHVVVLFVNRLADYGISVDEVYVTTNPELGRPLPDTDAYLLRPASVRKIGYSLGVLSRLEVEMSVAKLEILVALAEGGIDMTDNLREGSKNG